jgi:hypothetical protein
MTNAVKKAKAIELKTVVAVAKLKMQVRRTMKEIETLMQNVDDTFTRTKANLLIGQDENGVSYGLQKIKRKRSKFESKLFREQHNDLYYKYCTEIEYNEFKAVGGENE